MKRFAWQAVLIFAIMAAALAAAAAVFAQASKRLASDRFFADYGDSTARIQAVLKETYDENDPEVSFAALPENGFDRVLVLNAGGSVVYGGGEFSEALLSSLSAGTEKRFMAGEAFSALEKPDGRELFFLFAAADPDFGLRVTGIMERSGFAVATSGYKLISGLEIACFLIIISLAFVAVMLLYTRRSDDVMMPRPVKNYLIKVDKTGAVRSANPLFKREFGRDSIKDCIYGEKSIDYLAQNGEAVLLEFAGDKGEKRYLSMSCLKAAGGYKLVGCDAGKWVGDYLSRRESWAVDKLTGLKRESEFGKDWQTLCGENLRKRCAAVLINIGSRGYYEALVGENRVKKIVRVYAATLKETLSDYGELYAVSSEDIVLLIADGKKCAAFMEKLRETGEALNRPVNLNGQLYKPDAAMGVVLLSVSSGIKVENILYNAKLALKHARQSDSGNYYVLRSDDFSAKSLDFTEDGLVERMIADGEIQVCFQPQFDVDRGRVCGFEALSRLKSQKDRNITIKELVDLAEQYGGMKELNEYVGEKAMAFAKAIEKYGLPVSINVSPAQIMQMGFADEFLASVERFKLKPSSVCIEIVESTMVYSFNEIVQKLEILKSHGVGIHIDDFGVAYSSMLYLKKLPITALKIDKEFVDDITESELARALVRNIINLAADLKLDCICEGVETQQQCDVIRGLGCHIIQGYLFGAAVSRAEAERLIKEKNNGL